MNTVEQFITNTIDTYVTPIIEEFKTKGKNAVKVAGEETAQKVGGKASGWTNTFYALIAFVIVALIAGVTYAMKFWSIQRVMEFIKSIPARASGTYVASQANLEGGLSEVAAVSDISVTQV